MELKWYSKVVILAMIILGSYLLLFPSALSEPNFQGVPTIPIALFASALALYVLIEDYRKLFYATIVILLVILGYTGFWAYNYKMPLSSLETSMQIYRFYMGLSYIRSGNSSTIWFNLTIQNPTDIDTPPFTFENPSVSISNVKLKSGYNIEWGRSFAIDLRGHYGYYDPHIIIKAHQTLNIKGLTIVIYQNDIEVEEGNPQIIWEYLTSRNFTLSMSGTFTSRPNFRVGDTSRQSVLILAESPFLVSQKFSESRV